MPRPKKRRRICHLPEVSRFGPYGRRQGGRGVVMSVDEYEVIRLIDLERLKQEECAENMNIARTTVQSIYETARRKIADSLVNGKNLTIEGGEYMLCDGQGKHCGRIRCHRYRKNLDSEN